MYLNQVTIKNFRGIEDLTLAFKPGVNLIIGDNGVGKTSVLEAIVAGLGACFKELPDIDAVSIKQQDVRQELQIVDGSPFLKYHTPVQISCEMQVDDQTYTWSRVRKDEGVNAKTSIAYPAKEMRIADWFRNASNDIATPLPVLNYQSINRVTSGKPGDFGSSARKLNDRRYGYTACMGSALDDKIIRKWCYAMMRRTDSKTRYHLFRDAVVNVMSRMDEDKPAPEIDFSEEFGDFGEFVYREGSKVVPISFLSAGYQSCLWMVMDIAFRALILNPTATNLANISGIVLIDEVDKHLHPKWQWNVLDALRDTFPGIQFIITTHAPIVIGSCKDITTLSLSNDHPEVPIKSAYGYKIEDVIKNTQGSRTAIKGLNELYVEFENACVCKNNAEAERLFDQLNRDFPDSTERARAQTRLRFLKLGG